MALIKFPGWKREPVRPFFAAYKQITNDGVCCHIIPQIDFYSQTGKEPERMTHFSGHPLRLMEINESTRVGVHNGLTMLLDVEAFEAMAGTSSGQVGFKMALSNARDVPFIKDHMSYIAPG